MDRFLSMAILVYCTLERYLFILIPQPHIVRTLHLALHLSRRNVLGLLVACIILVSSDLVLTPSTRGSVTPYSFRDDFNYTSISQLQAAGWSINSQAPTSSYTVGSGALTLLYNGSVGADVLWLGASSGITNWSVSLRGRWIGNPVGSIALGVRTAGHSYSFLADGYYVPDPLGQCSCVRTNPGFGISDDGRGVARFPGYSPELDTWHILRVDMVQGTLYTYFDGVLVGDFTEFDTSAGNTNLAGIEVGAPWFANVQVDWVQASDSPSTPPTNPYFMVAAASSITVLPGQNVSDPIYVSSLGRFEGTVNLAAVAAPSSGLSVTMDPTVTVWVGEPKESTLYVAIQSTTMVEQSFTITVTATSGNLSTSVTINVNGLTDHNAIVINGDAGFTTANGITGGSGTLTDPYVIQGWAISTDFLCCASPGIVISNTKAYFTTNNVYINNPGSAGIELANVQNGVIKDSAMSNGVACYGSPDSCSNPDGVDITSSSNVKLLGNEFGRAISYLYGDAGHLDASISSSTNVTLRGNRFDASGIDVTGSPAQLSSYNINPYPSTYTYGVDPSLYNLVTVAANNISYTHIGMQITGTNQSAIYHNNFIQNDSQAYQSNTGITWDNGYPSGGNYWSNYAGVDNCSGPQQNICPSPDGIGDTPPSIDGTVYQDRYPLMKPFVDPPAVSFSVHVQGSFSASLGTISRTVSVTATNITSGEVIFVATRTITYQ